MVWTWKKQQVLKRGGNNTEELDKDLHDPGNHDVYHGNHGHSPRARHPEVWSQVGLREALLWTKLVEVMEFQLSYFKS